MGPACSRGLLWLAPRWPDAAWPRELAVMAEGARKGEASRDGGGS
jgi:hypothetical protein